MSRGLYFAWVVSLIALLSSLYYGEVLDMEPCRLCWYQRICMFPLTLFLGIAFYKKDLKMAQYCLPLVTIGSLLALYQSLIQIFPSLQTAALCGHTAHCTLAGPAPFFSTLAFVAIGISLFFFTKFSISYILSNEL